MSKELELLESISKKMDANQQIVLKEAKEAKEYAEKQVKEHAEKVDALNKELAEKGATIKQIQDEVLELKAKSGRIGSFGNVVNQQTAAQLISKAIEDNAEVIKEGRLGTTIRTEKVTNPRLWTKDAGTITFSNNVTGASISGVPTVLPEVAARGYLETHFRDLVKVFPSTTGIFTFFRSNTPTGEGSFGFTDPGATKHKLDKDLTQVVVNAKYLNGYVDVAKEVLTDIPFLSQFLSEELTNDYLDRETYEFFTQLVNGATGPTTTSQTDTAGKVIDYIAGIMQKKHRPTAVVVRPAAWANILNTKPADYSTPQGYSVLPSGQVVVASVPMYVSSTSAIAENKVLVGDFRQALLIQVINEGLKMEMYQQHDKAVYENLITFRAEARVALAQLRTEAFAYGNA